MSEQDDAPAGVESRAPSVARMYDYYLGGKDNYQVDREAADRMIEVVPEIRQGMRENRAFLRRAVRFMARQGIRQFIDIGAGLPTVGNTHEIAHEIAPDARVVYVDNDPVVLVHARALLATEDNITVAAADMRRPAEVFEHPETTRLLDFDAPVGALMIAMAHFLTDEERPRVMGYLHDALPSGSYLAATHVTRDNHSADVVARGEAVYASTPTPLYVRTHAEIARLFDGFEMVEPGLVALDAWRPDPADPAPAATKWWYGGVGRKG